MDTNDKSGIESARLLFVVVGAFLIGCHFGFGVGFGVFLLVVAMRY